MVGRHIQQRQVAVLVEAVEQVTVRDVIDRVVVPTDQEIAQCMLEDYGKNRQPGRGRLLLACAQHTALHRKYGDFLDCSRRYGEALGVSALQ